MISSDSGLRVWPCLTESHSNFEASQAEPKPSRYRNATCRQDKAIPCFLRVGAEEQECKIIVIVIMIVTITKSNPADNNNRTSTNDKYHY